jgi:hypothetical protein
MDLSGLSWALMNIVGPLILAAVLLWAMLRNRKASPAEIERTEQATRSLYREEDQAHRAEHGEAP